MFNDKRKFVIVQSRNSVVAEIVGPYLILVWISGMTENISGFGTMGYIETGSLRVHCREV